MKNTGIFFAGKLPQTGYGGSGSTTGAKVASDFEALWVNGANPWPGACDPTYSIRWASARTAGMYPELNLKSVGMLGLGCPFVPYSGVYDALLMTNNFGNVKN